MSTSEVIKMKQCVKCDEVKLLDMFHRSSTGKGGRTSGCKVCRNAAAVIYGALHAVLINAKVAAIRAANPEKFRAKAAKWAADHPASIKAKVAAYKVVGQHKNAVWRKNNPEACRSHCQASRARKRNAEGTHTPAEVNRLFVLQRGKCACCHTAVITGYHEDHIVALVNGGTNWIANIQLLCKSCNSSKGAKHPVDFMQSRGFLL